MIKLLDGTGSPDKLRKKKKRLEALTKEFIALNSDIICIQEGCNEERLHDFCNNQLQGRWKPILLNEGKYKVKGRQKIWFLVKSKLSEHFTLQEPDIWQNLVKKASWKVNYWGSFESEIHSHYRHPQVLIMNYKGQKVEFIGLHTKSKFVSSGKSNWNKGSGSAQRHDFIKNAIKARIKMTTEIANVRAYINCRFNQTVHPAIFVMGDLNDGPGKEFFEEHFLFFDLLSNLQGSVFEADKFLNHALFDYPKRLRWSCVFEDFIDPKRKPEILLDHILFTQSLVNKECKYQVKAKSGFIEHEIHDLVNAQYPKYAHTSDHRPVSVVITLE